MIEQKRGGGGRMMHLDKKKKQDDARSTKIILNFILNSKIVFISF